MSLADRVAARFAKTDPVSMVVARFKAARGFDGKFVGKDARLQWVRGEWTLEELPQKGKKKLRSATLQNPAAMGNWDWWIPGNILMLAKLSPSDDYDKIKSKMEDAYKEAVEKTENGSNAKEKAMLADPSGHSDWIRKLKWYEEQVFYLNVTPEGVDPFTAEGKDFQVNVTWNTFSATSPDSDYQQAQPYWQKYTQSSPTGARKLFSILKMDPNALKNISWIEFGKWLGQQKIPYDSPSSQWT